MKTTIKFVQLYDSPMKLMEIEQGASHISPPVACEGNRRQNDELC